MVEITFLTKKQAFGLHRLNVLKKYGMECGVTDLTILLGGFASRKDKTVTSKSNKTNCGEWFTKSTCEYYMPSNKNTRGDGVYFAYIDGEKFIYPKEGTSVGGRPSISYSEIKENAKEVKVLKKKFKNIKVVEYGEYPQSVVNDNTKNILNKKMESGELKKTNKKYHLNDEYDEYEYMGKRYIHVKAHLIPNKDNEKSIQIEGDNLKDYKIINDNGMYWVKVEPIKWLVDEANDIALSEQILFTGIDFYDQELIKSQDYTYLNGYYDNEFEKTNMYKFLNTTFAKDIRKYNIEKEEKTKVNKLIDDIKNIIVNKPYEETIIKDLKKIIANYNNELDKLKDKNTVSLNTPDTVVNNMETQLELILSNIREYNTKGNTYSDMNEYIDQILEISNNHNTFEYNELDNFQKDIYNIYNKSITFINNNERQTYYKQKLDTIFSQIKEDINKYITSKINIDNIDDFAYHLNYSNLEELVLYIRKEIQPIISELAREVEKYDVEKSISEAITNMVNSNYEVSNNKMISLYLNQINETFNIINEYIKNNEYVNDNQKNTWLEKINSIMINNVNYQQDMKVILNELKTKWLSLNKVMYEIEDYINEKKFIESNKIKL